MFRSRVLQASALAAFLALPAGIAEAAEVKIGLVSTLSGPPAALGQHLRDGFLLAVKERDGKLGGQDAKIIVVDDELKPDIAVTKAKALVQRD
ncbi:MAG TPA: ABC transporter substrate-binding protein, partial [Ancylobacter sp.]